MQYDKITTEGGKKYVEPFKAYQRKNHAFTDETLQISGPHREGFIPLIASNVIYLEELKKVMAERFAVD